MDILYLDFETSSPTAIKLGAHRYARDPLTRVRCMGWAFNDETPAVWFPGRPFPERVAAHFDVGAARSIAAHNAGFDRLIAWYVLCPDYDIQEPGIDAWYCTAAQARSRGYPGGLGQLGAALGLGIDAQKMDTGRDLIKYFNDIGDAPPLQSKLDQLGMYCARDVAVMRDCAARTEPLSDAEFAEYVAAEAVNDRGLRVDLEFALAATRYAKVEQQGLAGVISGLTGGLVTSTRQFARIKDWLADPSRGGLSVAAQRVTMQGGKIKLGQAVRADLLAMDEEDVPPKARELLSVVESGGNTAVSKFQSLVERADLDDERVRGAFIFSGAGATGRFSSTGAQLHNFPRAVPDNVEWTRGLILQGAGLVSPLKTLSAMLRPALVPGDGRAFVVGDWSAIEGRLLPWLAGERVRGAVARLKDYADGVDLYEQTAATFNGTRQEGKVAELALGYGGGVGALRAMARGYGLTFDDEKAAAIVTAWRAANPWAIGFWMAVLAAVADAVAEPGREHRAGRIVYTFERDGEDVRKFDMKDGDKGEVVEESWRVAIGTLRARLPSGRSLYYRKFAVPVERAGGSRLRAAWRPGWSAMRSHGGIGLLWYGTLVENVTQAAAADLLRACMVRVEAERPGAVVGHVHDELILEVEQEAAAEAAQYLEGAMTRAPAWAEGLPLAAKVWTGPRYGK